MAARQRQMLRNWVFFDAPVGMLVTLDRRLNTGSFMDVGMLIQSIMVAARAQDLRPGRLCLVPQDCPRPPAHG
jgi:hypothetical protein